MTDNTQPEAGSTHIIRYALELGLLWIDGDGRDKVREALDALDTLEAQLEAIGAGGVSGPLMGRTSISANAGEPRALNPRHIRKFLQALQAGEMSVSRAVEILDAWVGGYYEDEMVPLPPPDSCLIADDEFPMEIVRKLRSELAAAPPTAQAGGWMPIETAPKDSGYLLLRGGREQDVASGYWLQAAYAGNGAWIWPFVHMTPRFWAHLPPTSAEGVGS